MMTAMVQIESTTGVGSDPDIMLQKHASTGSSSYCRTNSSSLSSSGFCSNSLIIASSSISDSSSPAFQSNNNSSPSVAGVTPVPPVLPSVRTSTTTNTSHHQVRTMRSDNSTASSRLEMIDNSVSHSDSTEFDMPFGIDDDDLVNYQPPVIFSSRAGSMKCLNKRISSKSFELEAFEEEDLNLQENLPNKGLDSLYNFIRYVYVYFAVCSFSIPDWRTDTECEQFILLFVSKTLYSELVVPNCNVRCFWKQTVENGATFCAFHQHPVVSVGRKSVKWADGSGGHPVVKVFTPGTSIRSYHWHLETRPHHHRSMHFRPHGIPTVLHGQRHRM